MTGPYFLATKLVAFDGRGGDDYLMSHDIEDVVAVLDGRPEIVDEVRDGEGALRAFFSERFAEFLGEPRFNDALPGHLPGDPASQARLPIVIGRIETIAGRT